MTRALAIIVVLVTAPALALAKPRVAIVPVENDASGDVQDAIVDALDGGELTLVGPKQVARTVDKLGLEGDLSDKQLKKLANELEADAVIQSSVSSKGANKVLHFKLFVAGKKQKGFRIEFGSAKSAKFKSALHDKMVEKLGDAGGSAKKDDDDKPVVKKKKGSKADDDDSDKPVVKKKKGAADDDDSDKPVAKKKKGSKSEDDDSDKPVVKKKKGAADDDDSDKPVVKKKKGAADDDDSDKPKKSGGGDDDTAAAGDDDRPTKKKRTAHADDDADADVSVHGKVDLGADTSVRPANRAAIRVDAGVSLTGRSLTFATRTFTEGIGNPKPYKNSPVPGARVEGAVYPLAVGDPMAGLAGLGVAGFYDKTFSLGLHNALMPATTYKANEFRWDIGARYRLVIGAKPTSPSITVGIDYGHRQFKVTNRPTPDSGIVIDIPDVEYVGVTPNVELRLPIIPAVAFVAGGGSFLSLRAGAIQNPEQYGKATITEFQAYGGLDIVVSKRMAIRLTGDFAQFGYKFTGTGAMANDRDGDPGSKDVGGALDRYFGGAATFGVLY